MLIRANKCKLELELETLYRRPAILINYYNFYVDGAIEVLIMSVHVGDRKGGAIDVLIMSVHAGDRKGGAIYVFRQCQNLKL